ncbi:MAG: hypothetical protein HC836_15660 [Richelia sp. RM2_1_2]|nr:hypothetical protein [Richelia sp. RM2_1_2]
MRKYKLKENYFGKIDTEAKAYILGFLFADGYVNEKYGQISVTLHEKDCELLNYMVREMYETDRPLKHYKGYLRLVVCSNKMVSDLIKLGCTQRKTFTLKFPQIEEEFISHFMRGYFDGDGSITVGKDNTLNLSIVGTIEFLSVYQDRLKDVCQLNVTKFDDRHPDRKTNIRALRYGGNIIINRIFYYLYNNSSVSLTRKKMIFENILKGKPYFKNENYKRNVYQKFIEYGDKMYTKTELANILSIKLNQNKETIRRKLTNGWTLDEIFNTKLNYRRAKFKLND